MFDLKNDEVKLKFFPKTNKEHDSVTYDCYIIIDSYRFLSSSVYTYILVKILNEDDFVILIEEFSDKWQYLKKN